MRSLKTALILIALALPSTASASVKKHTTSKGSVFEQVTHPKLGRAWKAPNGVVWGKRLAGEYANLGKKSADGSTVVESQATRACAKKGGTLPSKTDYEEFLKHFEIDSRHFMSALGRKDLYAMFPDMKNQAFWTSSVDMSAVDPKKPDLIYDFYGTFGTVGHYVADYKLSVRCIAK